MNGLKETKLNALEIIVLSAAKQALEAIATKPIELNQVIIGDTDEPEWSQMIRVTCFIYDSDMRGMHVDCELDRSGRGTRVVSGAWITKIDSENKPEWRIRFRPDGILAIAQRNREKETFVRILQEIKIAPEPKTD